MRATKLPATTASARAFAWRGLLGAVLLYRDCDASERGVLLDDMARWYALLADLHEGGDLTAEACRDFGIDTRAR